MLVVRTTRIKMDTALGLVLSTFFGLGLVLLSLVQRTAGGGQAGLDRFLFGQAATLVGEDLHDHGRPGRRRSCFVLVLLWKEFKLLSFDPAFAGALGFPVRALDIMLTTLLVVAIVIGLQTVGVVLMSAMIVAPAAAARQWTDRLGVLVLLAGLFGAVSGFVGAVLSSLVPRLPTGPDHHPGRHAPSPLLSLLFAPDRGLLWPLVAGCAAVSASAWSRTASWPISTAWPPSTPMPAAAPHAVEVLRAMSPAPGSRTQPGPAGDAGTGRSRPRRALALTEPGVDRGGRSAGGGRLMSVSSWRSWPSPWSPPRPAPWWAPSSCCGAWPCSRTPSATPSCPASWWPSSSPATWPRPG